VTLAQKDKAARSYFWYVFRLIFIASFLYLAANLHSIWNGYRVYAASEFLPGLALAVMIWAGIAASATLFAVLLSRVLERAGLLMGWNITIDYLLLYATVLMLFGIVMWICKKLLWPDVHVTLRLALAVFASGAALSAIPMRLLRSRAEKLIEGIQKKITPLVWIFALAVVISVPVTAYNVWHEIQLFTSDRSSDLKQNTPLVTFVFDDGYESAYTKAKPVFNMQGEAACAGITVDYIGKKGRMTVSQIMGLQNDGWEILAHSISHPDLTKLPPGEIESEIRVSKERLEALGFRIVNFVYPFYRHNAIARNIARKYFRSARSGDVLTSGFNINPHALRMYALSAIDTDDYERLPALKGLVDNAEKKNAWLMITYHNLTPEREVRLNSIIDYIQEKGIQIVTIDQGLDAVHTVESVLAQNLFILNIDSPFHVLRNVHRISQHLLELFHVILLAG
jgi:peptidoglycan/xylan/chitin deacetylase (PgdA/CDA1 family)